MDGVLLAQFIMNGLMLGMMYALVAVGFTLFFGVLDIIVFSHGDTVMVGAFAGLGTYVWLQSVYPDIETVWLSACGSLRPAFSRYVFLAWFLPAASSCVFVLRRL